MALQVLWYGTDGSVWNLVDGPVRLMPGAEGFGLPDVSDQVKTSALADGQRLQSWRLEPRKVFLPLWFAEEANTDVTGVQRLFWRSMRFGETGTLVVTTENGETRSIGLRIVDDGGLQFQVDPNYRTDVFGVNMVADDPWWYGPVQTAVFTVGESTPTDFFGGGAPTFYIVPSTGTGEATISNPGDYPAFITWLMTGPLSEFSVTLNSRSIAGTISVSNTQGLVIETDPLRQVAYLGPRKIATIGQQEVGGLWRPSVEGATKVTRQLSAVDFSPIDAGASSPLEIYLVGTGVATAAILPRYARAF